MPPSFGFVPDDLEYDSFEPASSAVLIVGSGGRALGKAMYRVGLDVAIAGPFEKGDADLGITRTIRLDASL